jgi:hypothetical protein
MGSGVYDDRTGPELAQIISENAFVCIYLVFQFSQLGKKMVEGHQNYIRHAFGSSQVPFISASPLFGSSFVIYRYLQTFRDVRLLELAFFHFFFSKMAQFFYTSD